jgi:hypothetical protein
MEPITLKAAAALIARAELIDSADKVFQQLRGLANRGLLKSFDNLGPKAGYRYNRDEILAARLLIAALNCGVRSSVMDAFRNTLRIENTRVLPDGTHINFSLEQAIGAATAPERSNEIWVLEVTFFRTTDGDVEHLLIWHKDNLASAKNNFIASDPANINVVWEGSTTIPVTRILNPIVEEFRRS